MIKQKHSGFEALAQSELSPKEQLEALKKTSHFFRIGIPKEISLQENRISLTPDAVALLVNRGHEVLVERGAGEGSKFSDQEYSEVGAAIMSSSGEVYQADIILKIEPPTLEEINFMRNYQILFSALQPVSLQKTYVHALTKKKITALSFEDIEDKKGGFPIVRMLSEVAGGMITLIASEYLSSIHQGKGILFGGVTGVPSPKMVIIGAGTVAEYCARIALSLGVEIQIFDNHIYKLHRIKDVLGNRFYTSTIDSITLGETLKTADVVVGALRSEENKIRHVISEEMVSRMKPNSLIIDLSIDQGGCIATSEVTSHTNPVFKKYGVLHYCVPNVTSRVANTATHALSNIFTPILLRANEEGGMEKMIFSDKGLLKGIYMYRGNLASEKIAQKFNMQYKAIELLRAARV